MATPRVHYRHNKDITGLATAALLGGRFVTDTAEAADGDNIPVGYTAAGGIGDYVTGHDIANGERGHMHGPGCVVQVEAGATLARGNLVMADATGRAVPTAAPAAGATNYALGKVRRGATAGNMAEIWYFAAPHKV